MSEFVKAKLSHRAVDAFMLKYEDHWGHRSVMEYTTRTGQKIKVSLSDALIGTDEYIYLIGQLSAVHDGRKEFPINQVAIIRKKDGKDALWTRDTQLLKDFVTMGISLGILYVNRRAEGFIVGLNRIVRLPPVLHDETA